MGFIFGILLLLIAFYEMYKGEISVSYGTNKNASQRPSFLVTRAEKPVYFWFLVGGEIVIAIVLLTGLLGF
ncbi:MAG: hypothetical protein HZB18_12570 [Chloroflexi bacterium]|nr:hypothetical protein [Chloroflexota bacterium]